MVRAWAGRVTLRLAASPYRTTLDGDVTVAATNGEARFDRVWVTRAARGLGLVADTPELPSTTTAAFDVGIPFRSISAGVGSTCGVAEDGRGLCWGLNSHGVLGDGTQTNRPLPTPVEGDLRFAAIHSVGVSTCGVTTAGALYCWGTGASISLRNRTDLHRPVPMIAVPGLDASAVLGGWYDLCVLTGDARAYCTNISEAPFYGTPLTPVLPGTPAISIARGLGHFTCVVTRAEAALCTGQSSRTPLAPVAGDHRFRSVVTGDHHACALTAEGGAYCWGPSVYALALGTPGVATTDQPRIVGPVPP